MSKYRTNKSRHCEPERSEWCGNLVALWGHWTASLSARSDGIILILYYSAGGSADDCDVIKGCRHVHPFFITSVNTLGFKGQSPLLSEDVFFLTCSYDELHSLQIEMNWIDAKEFLVNAVLSHVI